MLYSINYLRIRSKVIFAFALIAFVTGCSREKVNPNVAAKVENDILTESDVKAALGSKYSNEYREEYIHSWIEERLFYLEAKKEKIINSRNYNKIIQSDKAEIAKGMLIRKILSEENFTLTPEEIDEYFRKNKEEFRLNFPAFNFDYAKFRDKETSENFRSIAIQKGWQFASNSFKNSKQIIKLQSNLFKKSYEVFPEGLNNILSQLNDGDLSIALKLGKNQFAVIRLIKAYPKGEVPPKEFLLPQIKSELLILKEKEFLNEYLNSLYSKYDVEIFSK